MLFEELDRLLEICNAGRLCAIVGGGDEVIDRSFVLLEERVDVRLVEQAGALRLREDEVEEEAEAEPCVERNPMKKEGMSVISRYLELRVSWAYQVRMKLVHDSTRRAQAKTTQYISHGVRRAGSEVLRAL